MERNSLGLIETLGFVAAIEAADAGSKAANVTFRGYERGLAGLITVVFAGDVAAVKAAVAAGTAAAKRVGHVVAVHVIARPDRQVHIGSANGHKSVQLKPPAPQETVEAEEQPLTPQENAGLGQPSSHGIAGETALQPEPAPENFAVTAGPSPNGVDAVRAASEYTAVAVAEAEEPVAPPPLEEAVSPEPAREWDEAIPTGGNGDAPAAKAKVTSEVITPDATAPVRKKEKVRPTKAKRKL